MNTALDQPASGILNISTYRFVPLDDLPGRRLRLKSLAESLELKGTILLSPEGINMFLAGPRERIEAFFEQLDGDPLLAGMQPKESLSSAPPFRRMLVRIKKEIIAFGVSEVDPIKGTSSKLPPHELKRWLDEGRPLCLLDVRNDYEIELGTFRDAQHLDIHHFRSFPQAIRRLPEAAKQQTIVMFCTGGIRCEKAGPLMEQAGFKNVYQLDGGILKYFEEVGGAHWDGSCFVFDDRVALDPQLQPTGDQLCYACQAVLHPADLQSSLYRLGESCPHCYQSPEQCAAQQLQQQQQRIDQVARQQPGTQPYDNYRSVYVPGKLAGLTLIDFLVQYQPGIAAEQWMHWIAAGQLTCGGQPVTSDLVVREGQHFVHHQPETVEPEINPNIVLLHEDDSLVVVDKPAPLPVHPCGRFNRNTLSWILEQAYPQLKLRVAHRLDANTSGVIVLCRKIQASRRVQPQFAAGQVRKEYLARVLGHPAWNAISHSAEISEQPTPQGQRCIAVPGTGQLCATRFEVLSRLSDGTSLIAAFPETGRTHQIRVHLWDLHYPIVGDPLYLPDRAHGSNCTLQLNDPPMCLHSKSITLIHPDSGLPATYVAPLPKWAES
ncbi:MAG: sulfurtransferase [Pirellulaceae bacterium]|nr:sulfurtransferase [Pirellulaceae bacterium]